MRIGIIGGGQLGRMLTQAAQAMGHEVTIVDPTPDSPAAQVGARQILGGLTDQQAIRSLARQSDVVTWEIEHIDTEILQTLQQEGVPVHPDPQTLAIIQDKLRQKEWLKKHKIPTAKFSSVRMQPSSLAFPLLLKTRSGGYDGRGNRLVRNKQDLQKAIKEFAGVPLYVESFVPFVKELAVIAARSSAGDIAVYPVVETVHQDNICHLVRAPAPVSPIISKKAQDIALKVLSHLSGAGVFCIELFLTKSGAIVVNEIAPRVHNSGHWTIEGAATSQFAQHIRAITGDLLGKVEITVPAAVMINILGNRTGPAQPVNVDAPEKTKETGVHLYGKKDVRLQRKMGHITAWGKTMKEAERKAREARKRITI